MKIFFDLDGPILEVSHKYHTLYSDLLKEDAYTPLSESEYWQLKRVRTPEPEILLKTCGESFIKPYLSRRGRIIEDLHYLKLDRLQDGVFESIKNWSREHDLYLVTMRKRRDTLIMQLDYLNIKDYFLRVYSENDNDGSWEVKRRLIDGSLGDPNECLIIGDTETDIKTGKALGIGTIAVTCGIRSETLLVEAAPDRIYEDVKSISLEEILGSF